MSSIEQTNTSATNSIGIEKKELNPVEFFSEDVKRGYDGKISQSHNDAVLEKGVIDRHRLVEPESVSASAYNLKSMKDILLKSEESIVQEGDLKNIANFNENDLSPEANKIKNDLKIMQGIKELENMLGQQFEASKKVDFLKFMAEVSTASKLSEIEDTKESKVIQQTLSETSETEVAKDNQQSKSREIIDKLDTNRLEPTDNSESSEEVWSDIWEFVNGNTDELHAGEFSEKEKAQIQKAHDSFNLVFKAGGGADIAAKVGAIVDGPPELVASIKKEFNKVMHMMSFEPQLWDTDEISTILSSIQQQMQDNRLKFDQETIKIGQLERERISKETINKIKEQIKKEEEAEKTSLVAKIFGYIGLALMAIATVAAFATGVGAVAGAALIAAMGMMVVMTVDQEMGGELVMKPMAQSIMNTFGVDDQTANWIATAIIMVIITALSLGGGAAATAKKTASKVAILATRATMVTGGAASIGEGAAGIASGVQKHDAEMLRADTKELNAEMLRIQRLIDDAVESLQQALEELQAGYTNIAAIISSNDDTKKIIGRNIKGS